MNTTCGCLNFGFCHMNATCVCRSGNYGTLCELHYAALDVQAFEALRWTMVSLCAILMVLSAACLFEFWIRNTVKFPRVNKEQLGLFCCFCACSLELAYNTWDPFRAVSSGTELLTQNRIFALGCLSNLSIACVTLGWLVIFFSWLAVRLYGPHSTFLVVSAVMYVIIMCFLIGLSIGAAWAASVGVTWPDLLYYIVTAAIALMIGVSISISGFLTLKDLRKFKHHSQRLKRLAGHMIVVGVIIVCSIVILGITSTDSVGNTSWTVFYVLRGWVAFCVFYFDCLTILLMLRWRRWKGRSGVAQQANSTARIETTTKENNNNNTTTDIEIDEQHDSSIEEEKKKRKSEKQNNAVVVEENTSQIVEDNYEDR